MALGLFCPLQSEVIMNCCKEVHDHKCLLRSHFQKFKFQIFPDVLVASRRCVARLKDLKPDEIIDFFMTVCKCQRLLEQHYGTNASTVTVQDGECAGQTVKVS